MVNVFTYWFSSLLVNHPYTFFYVTIQVTIIWQLNIHVFQCTFKGCLPNTTCISYYFLFFFEKSNTLKRNTRPHTPQQQMWLAHSNRPGGAQQIKATTCISYDGTFYIFCNFALSRNASFPTQDHHVKNSSYNTRHTLNIIEWSFV